METKSVSDSVAAYQGAIGSVPAKYKKGIQAATNVIEKSKAAESTYAAGVAEAVANKSRLKGLEKVTDADWKRAADEKGSARIGAGMTAGVGKFSTGISGVLSTLQGINLPPRTIDPEANVDNRVKPIVRALHEMKKR